jgi:hypothetical protein
MYVPYIGVYVYKNKTVRPAVVVQARRHMPITWRLRQEDYELEASLAM